MTPNTKIESNITNGKDDDYSYLNAIVERHIPEHINNSIFSNSSPGINKSSKGKILKNSRFYGKTSFLKKLNQL